MKEILTINMIMLTLLKTIIQAARQHKESFLPNLILFPIMKNSLESLEEFPF